MKTIVLSVIVLLLMVPMSSAFASWHWSSPQKVCGDDVIKKTEECHLDSHKSTVSQIISPVESDQMMCKDGLKEIIKKSTNTVNCVKESSYEKLLFRGWGTSP
jgi:hypothetical protein